MNTGGDKAPLKMFPLRKLLSSLMEEKLKLTQSKMEGFHSDSFGLDVGIICQGTQNAL